MSGFTPQSTWGNARKVAGISDSRQVRDVKYGNLITYAKFPFLCMFGGTVRGEDGKMMTVKPTIKSSKTNTLTPELYDDEVAPNLFRITADASGAVDVGDSVDLTFDDVSGLQANDQILIWGQKVQALITAISGTTVTATILYSESGSVLITGSSSDRNVEKLGSSLTDAPTVGVGSYREMIQRTNNLQFMLMPMSQGILQAALSLHGTPGGEGAKQDMKAEKYRKMVDFNKARENTHIFSLVANSTGSGESRRLTAKGLYGWAGGVVNNTNANGELPWEDLVNVHVAAAREAGGSRKIYALVGSRVATVLTSFYQKQKRIHTDTNKYSAVTEVLETPSGDLHLVYCDAMDSPIRQGQMLTFQPEYLERRFLEGLDFRYQEGLELNNILGERAAYMACEALMASKPECIKIHTNILKAA